MTLAVKSLILRRMKNSKYILLFFLMSLGSQTHAYAASGNLTVISDYVFRGITQSDEKPALQSSISIGEATGAYGSLWASNVDFNDGGKADFEIDASGGYKWAIDAMTLDIGAIYYAYPGPNKELDYDYAEAKLGLSLPVGAASFGFNFYISPDYFAGSGVSLYSNAAISMPIQDTGFSTNASIGYQTIEDENAFGVPDYADWNIGFSYTWKNFTLGLNYYDTNLNKTDCPDGCEARFVAGITHNF